MGMGMRMEMGVAISFVWLLWGMSAFAQAPDNQVSQRGQKEFWALTGWNTAASGLDAYTTITTTCRYEIEDAWLYGRYPQRTVARTSVTMGGLLIATEFLAYKWEHHPLHFGRLGKGKLGSGKVGKLGWMSVLVWDAGGHTFATAHNFKMCH
jgi:hypothetical protein